MGNPPNGTAAPTPRRSFFLVGVLIFLLGIGAIFVQTYLKRLIVPWYLPVTGTIGVLLMAAGAWQRRGVLRFVGFAVFVLLCGAEWFMLLGSRVPDYAGPAQPGQRLPAFAAAF